MYKIDWSLDSFGEKKLIATGPKSDDRLARKYVSESINKGTEVAICCMLDDASKPTRCFLVPEPSSGSDLSAMESHWCGLSVVLDTPPVWQWQTPYPDIASVPPNLLPGM